MLKKNHYLIASEKKTQIILVLMILFPSPKQPLSKKHVLSISIKHAKMSAITIRCRNNVRVLLDTH